MTLYVTIELQGGLGNQLFQLFTAYALSKIQNAKLVMKNKKVSSTYPNTHRVTYYDSLLDQVELFPESEEAKFNWHECSFELFNCKEDRNNMLHGYHQDFHYFDSVAAEYLEKLQIADKQKHVFLQNPSYLDSNKINVAIHFRLGDYKHKQFHHPLLPIAYYKNAILALGLSIGMNRLSDCNFLIFCEPEDQAIVSQIMGSMIHPDQFKMVSNTIKDEDQLLLMSLCSHFIIANSTYSWWAAYISTKQHPGETQVFLPYKWFWEKTGNNYIVPGWNTVSW